MIVITREALLTILTRGLPLHDNAEALTDYIMTEHIAIRASLSDQSFAAEVKAFVAQECNVSVFDMEGKSQKREFVEARQIAMYVLRHTSGLSLAKIGKLFGNRDHSTVIHACVTIKDLIFNKKFREKTDLCMNFATSIIQSNENRTQPQAV